MNRYPLWKYAIIVVAVIFGFLYSSPTLLSGWFGSAPVVLVSATSVRGDVDLKQVEQQVRDILGQAGVTPVLIQTTDQNVNIRLDSEAVQAQVRNILNTQLGSGDTGAIKYVVAVSKEALTPKWLQAIGAKPVNLGLDLRGGVHFLLQVDMEAALGNRLDALVSSLRSDMRRGNVQYSSVSRKGDFVEVILPSAQSMAAAMDAVRSPEVQVVENTSGGVYRLQVSLSAQTINGLQENALQQNMATLHNRINALGIAEPLIQQQGSNRIVVQLPGEEDPTRVKDILGRMATLQFRMVDESQAAKAAMEGRGPIPLGSERFTDRDGYPIILLREVHLTGENLVDAQPARDENNMPAISLRLDGQGAEIFRLLTSQNVGKRMAIVLFEEGNGVVLTAPTIRQVIPNGQVQISGAMNVRETVDVSLLLRSGSLAAPMNIIEERTIGPTLGEENIARGVNSVIYGFAIVAAFMCVYYMLFGVFSTVSMFINLLLLVSVMSLMQATLTLPGIAAMALALGMAIDANVLINERVREELRAGASPHMAINAGYEHAWGTILDSNITSLIAGIALLTCDAGPIRGFAVVHCLGILTSLFSSVFVSRGLVNLWYGRRRKLDKLAIGQVWKPQQD